MDKRIVALCAVAVLAAALLALYQHRAAPASSTELASSRASSAPARGLTQRADTPPVPAQLAAIQKTLKQLDRPLDDALIQSQHEIAALRNKTDQRIAEMDAMIAKAGLILPTVANAKSINTAQGRANPSDRYATPPVTNDPTTATPSLQPMPDTRPNDRRARHAQ